MNANSFNTILNVTVLEKMGEVSGIFDILVKKHTDNNLKESIIKSLRHDSEKNRHGLHVLKENPSKESSEIDFKYSPTFYRQRLSQTKFPYKISDTIELIDAFSCMGSRFGLQPLSVFVEVFQSSCIKDKIWANVYYVADSEIPACSIKVTTLTKSIN